MAESFGGLVEGEGRGKSEISARREKSFGDGKEGRGSKESPPEFVSLLQSASVTKLHN